MIDLRRPPLPPIGWPLIQTPKNGMLSWPTLEESIKESIQVILLTRKGELLMRPEFGAGLDRFLHEPDTLLTRSRLREEVTTALNRWEPRIALERVDVRDNAGRPGTLFVDIFYSIRRTREAAALTVSVTVGS